MKPGNLDRVEKRFTVDEVSDESEWDTGEDDEQIGDGQVHEEDVGDTAALVIGPQDSERHQRVTN